MTKHGKDSGPFLLAYKRPGLPPRLPLNGMKVLSSKKQKEQEKHVECKCKVSKTERHTQRYVYPIITRLFVGPSNSHRPRFHRIAPSPTRPGAPKGRVNGTEYWSVTPNGIAAPVQSAELTTVVVQLSPTTR
jgi:hypothetical protein